MVLILDTPTVNDSVPPKWSGGGLGWCGQKEGGGVGHKATVVSLRLSASRVLSGLKWKFM